MKVEEGLYEGGRAAYKRDVGREKATGADELPKAFQFLAAWVGLWVARQQADQIEYLKTVNRSLIERLGKKRWGFTDGRAAEAGGAGKGARLEGPGGSGHDRDAGHDLALVPRKLVAREVRR